MDKVDPHNSQHYLALWKKNQIAGISKKNAVLLRQYILDMELGINTSGHTKGGRSPIKLLAIARQMKRLLSLIEERFKLGDVSNLSANQLHTLFFELRSGKITRIDGKPYKAVGDYAARFKAFWHWYMKVMRKQGVNVLDVAEELQAEKKRRSDFVYFTEHDLERMVQIADYDTQVFMLFLFDTGIRSPTEAMNVRVSDFSDGFTHLTIRDEVSKTFGRKIRLMMCSQAIAKYITDNHLSRDDLLFTVEPATMNKRLKAIGNTVLSDRVTLGRKAGNDLTMYDFRHSSCCFWLPRYKSRNSMLYRFGWKKEEELHYYSDLLGMTDTMTEGDMLVNVTKTELERELINQKNELALLKAQFEELGLFLKSLRETMLRARHQLHQR